MAKDYGARFDIRVEPELKKAFQEFCKQKRLKISDAGREALGEYINSIKFRDAFLEHLQDIDFYRNFSTFYEILPDPFKKDFEDFLGPEEESLVNRTPKQLLGILKVITIQGQKALDKKCKNNSIVIY